jgi:MFS family permease
MMLAIPALSSWHHGGPLVATPESCPLPPHPNVAFAALRHPGYRQYFAWSAMAMMADSVEHVISYWVCFQKFHSPALGGFAVISHWLPFLLFSVYSGLLTDRYDPRRMIQLGMGLFSAVSVAWGLLFWSGFNCSSGTRRCC